MAFFTHKSRGKKAALSYRLRKSTHVLGLRHTFMVRELAI
jgi:hypothetical protein